MRCAMAWRVASRARSTHANSAAAIGSGGAYAQSAAKALMENTDLSPRDVVEKSLRIAGELCIYTNTNFVIETLE